MISVEFVTFVWRTATILFILSLAANSIHWERVQPFLRYAILRPIDAVRKMSGSGTYRLRGPVPSHFRYWRLSGGAAPVPCRSFSVWTRTRPRVHTGAEERRSKVNRQGRTAFCQ